MVMVWVDFMMCAAFGWTGIHKFKEQKVAQGILYFMTLGLCGVGWVADTVGCLIRAVRRTGEICAAQSRRLPEGSPLPVIGRPALLELRDGEVCRYEQNAALLSPKAVSEGGRRGAVCALGADMAVTLEPRSSKYINWRKAEELLGRLYVTDRRLVLTDGRGGAECPVESLRSVEVFRNLLLVRGEGGALYLATDEAAYVYQIVARVCREQIKARKRSNE